MASIFETRKKSFMAAIWLLIGLLISSPGKSGMLEVGGCFFSLHMHVKCIFSDLALKITI
jgi:hypothetical protein